MRCPIFTLSLVVLAAATASADRLELVDGTVLQGSFAGGEAAELHFRLDGGELRSIAVSDLRSLHFEAPPAPSLSVPSRTMVRMRLTQPIGHDSHAGSFFKGVLDEALVIDGVLVAAEGTPALGRISSSKGASGGPATLRLTDLIIGGHRHRVTADPLPLGGTVDAQSLLEFRLTSNFEVLETDLGR